MDGFAFKHDAGLSWAQSGVTISAHHLTYHVDLSKKKRKALLRDISMYVGPGELCYLMGPSGAGKTTLLEVLAGRVQMGVLSGEVLFNGQPRDGAFWRESAYVKQDDVHIPVLTVQETLQFAARLRMGSEFTEREREERVARVAELLGLDVCLHSICGDALTRGVSGGQLKRVSIGVEIINTPSLIFLDEPTSGLDSVIAHETMAFVHKIARQNRTVLATIHQPSPDTFALSTTTVLLAPGGRIAYCGPSAAMQAYFEQGPSSAFSPEGYSNPADFALAIVGGSLGPRAHAHAYPSTGMVPGANGNGGNGNGNGNGRSPLTPQELAERFRASEHHAASLPPIPAAATALNAASPVPPLQPRPQQPEKAFPTSLGNQCRVLLARSWLTQARQLGFIRAQLAKNVIVALVCGAIFYGQGAVKPPSEQFNQESFNISSILYFAMMYTIVGNLQAIPQLFAMRVQYTRERSAGLYSTFAYWLAGALVNLPLVVTCHLIFINIAYWLVQLDPTPSVYVYATACSLLNNLVAFYFAQFLAAAAPSAQVALAVFPVTFLFLTSFAGFTVPLQNLPSGWVWASYVSYPRWCYEGLVANQFSTRIDEASTLAYYGFGGWRPGNSIPVLLLFVLGMNALVYWGLLPARSRLRLQEDEEAAAGAGAAKGVKALDFLRVSADSVDGGQEGKDEREGAASLRRPLLPLPRASSKEAGLSSPLPTVAPEAAAAGAGTAHKQGGGGGLRQKLLAADEKDLSIPQVLLESLTGTSDTALIDSRLNDHHLGGGGGGGSGAWSQQQPSSSSSSSSSYPHTLDVKDYESRSAHIQKSRGIRLLFREVVYSIPAAEPGDDQRGPLLKCLLRSKRRRAEGEAAASGGSRRMLLKGASGRVNPGEMCALMGGSGAGKTTLLDVLAGRKTSGCITGEVYFNGRQGHPSPKRCSYVTQDNVHIGCFTVRETLHYASLLRVREGATEQERRKRVEDVMMMLGLEGVADVIVGDALRKGISGGQARRLTIGVEIINLPDLIFLDEPTTGLDSNISYEVMAAVRNLANQNRTVVCTIHQPSIEVFALFDKLILLAPVGEQVYYGSTHEAVKYFSSPALDFEFHKGANPAEFVMSASQGGLLTRGGLKRGIHELAQLYQTSDLFQQFNENMDTVVAMDLGAFDPKDSALESRLFPRDLRQINAILTRRQFLKMRKNRRPVVVAVVRHVLVALFYGSLYWQVAPTAIQSRLSLLFFAIMFVMLGNQQAIPSVFEDRLLYYREKGAHVYGAYSYWMTCATAYVPQNLINTLIYSAIVYHMAGLNATSSARFGYFYLVIALCSLCALTFCQLLSITLPSPQTAVAVFPAALFLFIAFAGFIVRLPSLPAWLGSWCPDASFARWAFQGLVINEFEGNPRISYAGLPAIYYTPDPYQTLIESLGFAGVSKWFSLPILLLNIVVFRALTYASLVYVNHEKR